MTEIGKPPKHKTTHQDAGADEIDAAGLVGRINLVNRGDPSAFDFTQANLTADGAWNDLDLSSIVPAGAIAVLLLVNLNENSIGPKIKFRKNGNANNINISEIYPQVSGLDISKEITVFLDTNRVIEYLLSVTGWDQINIVVRGWWI